MADQNEHNLSITRLIDAPIDRVWNAWTNANEIKKWWGPNGVTNPTCIWEAEPGGKIDIVMLAGEELGELSGQKWPMTGKFVEVKPKTTLVYNSTAIIDNKPVLESLNTVTLESVGDQTKMTLKVVITKATAEAEGPLAGMSEGWNQTLDKLNTYLEGSN